MGAHSFPSGVHSRTCNALFVEVSGHQGELQISEPLIRVLDQDSTTPLPQACRDPPDCTKPAGYVKYPPNPP